MVLCGKCGKPVVDYIPIDYRTSKECSCSDYDEFAKLKERTEMITQCEKCGDRFNDVTVSTVCPHKGIGFCRACDCFVCVCSPKTRNRKSNRYNSTRWQRWTEAARRYWQRWNEVR